MLIRLFLVTACLILLSGCGENPIDIVDVMSDITEDSEMDNIQDTELELPTIEFNVDFEPPTIPEDADILENDRVFHVEELRSVKVLVDENDELTADPTSTHKHFDPFIFDAALDALTDEDVLTHFEWWELNIEMYCKTSQITESANGLRVYFTSRIEADNFADKFVDVNPWNLHRSVNILNSENVYYTVSLSFNFRKVAGFCE